MRTPLLIIAAILAANSTRSNASPLYHVVEIPLPAGAISVTPTAMNASGQVVGSVLYPTQTRPFSYSAATGYHELASPAGHLAHAASGVNDAGQIVGHMIDDRGIPKSALWRSSADPSPMPLESSGGSDANVYATHINNAGRISGYYTGSGSGNVASWRAVRWDPDGERWRQNVLPGGLASPPPGVFHAGYAINDAGVVVGTGSASNVTLESGQAAVQWTVGGVPSGLAVLTDPIAYPRYEAVAINNTGQVTGHVTDTFGHRRALLWGADGSVLDLAIPIGFDESVAIDINAMGTVIGQTFLAGAPTAVVLESNAWVQLATRVQDAALWNLTGVSAINDSGWIAGTGSNGDAPKGILLVPFAEASPGDANVDFAVDFDDLLVLAQHYGQAGLQTWQTGDFTGDAAVGFDDLLLLAQHYRGPARVLSRDVSRPFAADWAMAQSVVPEPASWTLGAALTLFRRRRTR